MGFFVITKLAVKDEIELEVIQKASYSNHNIMYVDVNFCIAVTPFPIDLELPKFLKIIIITT